MLPSLTGETQRFWTDAAVRRSMFRAILDAHQRRNERLTAARLTEVDNHVVDGMAALSFRRAPLRDLSLDILPGAAGVKEPDCHLRIGLDGFIDSLTGQPDEIVVTWIHES